MLNDCYCTLIDALVKNWEECGLSPFFDSSVIIDEEAIGSPTGPYAVIDELPSQIAPTDINCEAITDRVTSTLTLHCSPSNKKAKDFGTQLRSVFHTKFKNVSTQCGTIKNIQASRPNVVRIGSQWMMRIQFNVFYVTGV